MTQTATIEAGSPVRTGGKEPGREATARIHAEATLKRWIREGVLPAGDTLPGERELALRLSINRGTLRLALASMTNDGLLRTTASRARIVVGSVRRGNALSQSTVVTVTRSPEGMLAGHRSEGWSDNVAQGVIDSVGGSGRHYLGFQGDRICSDQWPLLIESMPRGIVWLELENEPAEELPYIEMARNAGIPLVAVGDHREFAHLDRVTSDHALGGRMVTEHLLSRGRKNIVVTAPGYRDSSWFRARYAGYELAHHLNGLKPMPRDHGPELPTPDNTVQMFVTRRNLLVPHLQKLFDASPQVDAIVTCSDGDIPALAAALKMLGRLPNVDVDITGYDNFWEDCFERQFEPEQPLVTVSKQNRLIGSALTRLLDDRIAGILPDEPQRRFVEPLLLELGCE